MMNHSIWKLVQINVLNDFRRIACWVVAIPLLLAAVTLGLQHKYDTPEKLGDYARSVGASPTFHFFNGEAYRLDNLGSQAIYDCGMYLLVAVAVMASLLVTNAMRKQEQEGILELARSEPTGRFASLYAGLLELAIAVGAISIVTFLTMTSIGLELPGSAVYASALFGVGVVFGVFSAVISQLAGDSHIAARISLAAVALAWLVWGIADVTDTSWLRWVSPLAWARLTRPYDTNDSIPLVLLAGLATVLFVLAILLSRNRDLGTGLIQSHSGSRYASRWLKTRPFLLLRLERSSILTWSVVLLVLGLVFGLMGPSVDSFKSVLSLGEHPTVGFWSFVTYVGAILIGFAGITHVQSARDVERQGLLESQMATSLSRIGWLAQYAVLALLCVTFYAVLLGGGISFGGMMTDGVHVDLWRIVGESLAYLPASAMLIGFAILSIGIFPRYFWLSWIPAIGSLVIVLLGVALDLPTWLTNVSPYKRMPTELSLSVNLTPFLLVLLVALAFISCGLIAFKNRDLLVN